MEIEIESDEESLSDHDHGAGAHTVNTLEESEHMTSTESMAGDSSSEEILAQKLERRQNNTLQRMKFYPMILILCYLFATIRRVIDWATEDQTPYYWAMLHTFFAAIPGFLNAIVYGLTKDVKHKNIEFWTGICGKDTGQRTAAVQLGDGDDSEDDGL